MNPVHLIDFLRDRLQGLIRLCYVLLALLVVADVARWFLARGHHEAPAPAAEHGAKAAHGFLQSLYHIAETVPGFWSLFGFLSCAIIVYVSKAYGHAKIGNSEIMTREDYYNE